ncbi:MAG: hypothetical protein ACKOHH_05115, partial [Bacteroidota bacterium]
MSLAGLVTALGFLCIEQAKAQVIHRLMGVMGSERWPITYQSPTLKLRFHLAMTAFKHVGLFPEQADNWEFIASAVRALPAQC